MRTAPWSFLAFLFLSPLTAAQTVHLVDDDGGPGVDFTSLPQAVAAAASGDIVLVRPGVYAPALVFGKSLTIHGFPTPGGAAPEIQGLDVRNLAANQRVVLRGLNLSFFFATSADSLVIRDCVGPVIVEDCRALLSVPGGVGPATVVVEDSDRVSFIRCQFRGSDGAVDDVFFFDDLPLPGIHVTNSTVTAYVSTFSGGHGLDATVSPLGGLHQPQTGAPGVDLVSGKFIAVGCTVVGGSGGDGLFTAQGQCVAPADGGPGMRVAGALTRMAFSFGGGLAGNPAVPCTQTASQGAPLELAGGTVATFNEALRTLVLTAPGVEGQTVTTTVTGVPGEQALLLISFAPAVTFTNALKGTLIGAFPMALIGLGTLPPSGTLSFDATVGILPPGVGGVHLYEQVIVPGTFGSGVLSSPSVTLLLDSSF